jgi:ribosomal protein S27E
MARISKRGLDALKSPQPKRQRLRDRRGGRAVTAATLVEPAADEQVQPAADETNEPLQEAVVQPLEEEQIQSASTAPEPHAVKVLEEPAVDTSVNAASRSAMHIHESPRNRIIDLETSGCLESQPLSAGSTTDSEVECPSCSEILSEATRLAECTHEPNICGLCCDSWVYQHIIDRTPTDQIPCPSEGCDARFSYDEVREHTSPGVFEE